MNINNFYTNGNKQSWDVDAIKNTQKCPKNSRKLPKKKNQQKQMKKCNLKIIIVIKDMDGRII